VKVRVEERECLLYAYGELFELWMEVCDRYLHLTIHRINSFPVFDYWLSFRHNEDKLEVCECWTTLYIYDHDIIEQFLDALQKLLEEAVVVAERHEMREEEFPD